MFAKLGRSVTKRNMHAIIIVQATAGAICGIVSPGHVPAGGTKVTAPSIMHITPMYKPIMTGYIKTVKQAANIKLSKGLTFLFTPPVYWSTPMT